MPLVLLGPLAVDIFLPALPIMASALLITPVQIQWTITIYMFSLGVGQLTIGPISDKLGRKPIILTGVAVYLITSLAVAYTTSFTMHLFFRGLQGIGACAIMVACFASVTDKFNEQDSAKVYSYLHGIIFCVPALAPVLGYQLTESYGWQSNFIFMSVIAFIIAVITFKCFKETSSHSVNSNYLPKLKSYAAIALQPSFLLHAIIVMFSMATIMAFVSTAPNVFVIQFGLPAHVFTVWFSFNAALTILGSFTVPKLLSRYSLNQLIFSGSFIVLGSGFLLMMVFNEYNILSYILPVMMGTIGFSLVMGTAISKALSPYKSQAGLATALVGFIQMSGAASIVTIVQALNVSPVHQVIGFSLSFIPLILIKISLLKKAEQTYSQQS